MEWPCFDPIDRILGHKPTTVPEAVVDSLALHSQSQKDGDQRVEVREDVNKVDETLFGDTSDSATMTSTSTDTSAIKVQESKSKKKTAQGETSLRWQ